MRSTGVLLPVSSLPSAYGIGTLGKEARNFIDFLKNSDCHYWQVLPIGPTSYGDSPYQSYSSYAGNPYFIDLKELIAEGYLTKKECENANLGTNPESVDYAALYYNRFPLLFIAADRFLAEENPNFMAFCENTGWLYDYALFMALKDANEGRPWYEWEDGLKFRRPEALEAAAETYSLEMAHYFVLQYWFDCQWRSLSDYAHENGISLIGDIPIYVAYDSVEVWTQPEYFSLDDRLKQVLVAGCPPDAFCDDGQLWGNPIYRWNRMQADGYTWWIDRVGRALDLFDVVRIDHFRGFASYYVIPAGDLNAKGGHWEEGPGMDLFEALGDALGQMNIIAEDLGLLTPDVFELLEDCGYPGMKVLQFAFSDDNGENLYYPHNYTANSVVYTGTHDNDTSRGWYASLERKDKKRVTNYLGISPVEGPVWGLIRGALASVSQLAVIPMQDLLELDSGARINRPATLGGNWQWRMKKGQDSRLLAHKLSVMNHRYGRAND